MHKISIILLLSFLAAIAGPVAPALQQETATQVRDLSNMFYTDTLPPKAEPPQPTLAPKTVAPVKKLERRVGVKYRLWHLTVGPNCENIDVQEVPSTNTFRSGDRIRLIFESNVDGYLYVLQKGSTGRDKLLFPNLQQGADNRIKRGIQYAVPSKKWFVFDNNPGEERLTVVVSRTPLKSLPQQYAPQDEKTVSTLSVVAELNQSVRPRDLVIFQEKETASAPTAKPASQTIAAPASQATIVINTNSDVNNAAYVEIRLKHE